MFTPGSLTVTYRPDSEPLLHVALKRDNVADRLCAGKSIAEAIELISQTYTLCRYAQRAAAKMVLTSTSPDQNLQRAAQLEIVEQTLWRWMLDLPKLILPTDSATSYLPAYAQLRKRIVRWQKALTESDSQQHLPTRGELVELSELVCHQLGIGALVKESLSSEVCLHWIQNSDDLAARIIRGAANTPFLSCNTSELCSDQLFHHAKDFCRGSRKLSGSTSARVELQHAPLLTDLAGNLNEVQLTLLARLLLIVETLYSLDTGQNNLRQGFSQVDDTALSWVLTARGLLVHRVQFSDDKQRVGQYQIFAPTDFNFGDIDFSCTFFLQNTDLMQGNYTTRILELSVLALDPCVDYTIEVAYA